MKNSRFILSYKFPAFLAITSGLLLYLISVFGDTDPLTLRSMIEANLRKQVQWQDMYIDRVSADFSVLTEEKQKEVDYPTFVFTKRKLAFWNTSQVALDFGKLAGLDDFGVTSIHQSKYLYQRRTVVRGRDRYILVSLIPLMTRYPFTNQYLTTSLNRQIFASQVEYSDETEAGAFLVDLDGLPLLFVKVANQNIFPGAMLGVVNFLAIAFILLLILTLYLYTLRIGKQGKLKTGFGWLILGNVVVRGLLLISGFPFALTGMELFNSSTYVSSAINPSLGDLLFNIVSLLSVSAYLFENRIYLAQRCWEVFSPKARKILYTVLYLVSLLSLYCYSQVVRDILANSQINLDMGQTIEFDNIRVFAFVVIVLSGLIAFLIIHVFYKIVFHKRKNFISTFLTLALPTVIFGVLFGALVDEALWGILIYHTVYMVIIYINDLPSRMRKFRFGSLLYILSAIILVSLVGAVSVYRGFERNELIQKQKFATKLLIDRDVEAEYLLNQIAGKIRTDMTLNSKIISPRVSVSQVKDRISQLFVDGYFSGYNIKISLFDQDGVGIGRNMGLVYYDDYKHRFVSAGYRTDYENIFFDGNFLSSGRKRYVCFIELERYKNRTGFIILELNQKKQVSRSVYPELLLDNSTAGRSDFDYAVFDSKDLVHSVGQFNYKADFNTHWIDSRRLYARGVEKNGHHHLAVRTDNRVIVITSKLYKFWSGLSNFSFLFVLFMAVAVVIMVTNSLINYETIKSFNFSTKILIYLGCAFAIPLVLVGAAILNTLNKSYKAEIDKSYQKQTIAMSENFVDLITDFYNNDLNRDGLSNELLKISRSSRADINLYDNEGRMLSTSQPKIIEAGLLSPYINPVAFNKLKNEYKDKVILEESIGKLSYKSSFVAVRSYDDGKLLGIMSSPFFSSKNHLGRQKTEVFANIINISTLIFMISIGLSYVAVRRLTNPIMLIASKLKRTEFSEENPPLEWTSNDEIGMLVREYNSMLEKLEISKKELARSEKEAAWREMAKQVAHEIKNPLTPMKLTLQHLDRVMDKDDERRKSLSTLLAQVDTLDQIVTSFSHFARMPDPENETFNLITTLEKSINLHPDKHIVCETTGKKAMVTGDKKLFGRIFNNIILNAFQAMNNLSSPVLTITIEQQRDKVLLAFRDIGSGIPDEIKDKVFVPNFSTKASGSGIGLAVAKRGIAHAGGNIWFEANQPVGTIFYIELPLADTQP